MSTTRDAAGMYEAGSAYRIQPHLRSNARAVDRGLALKIRCSDSDGPRGHCTRPSVPRVGRISFYRTLYRTSSRSPKHATDGRSPWGTPFESPPRALATSCARATERAIRVQDALSHRESLHQPILGQLRSSVILVSKTEKTTFQIHHIALSAHVAFRLTLSRMIYASGNLPSELKLFRLSLVEHSVFCETLSGSCTTSTCIWAFERV